MSRGTGVSQTMLTFAPVYFTIVTMLNFGMVDVSRSGAADRGVGAEACVIAEGHWSGVSTVAELETPGSHRDSSDQVEACELWLGESEEPEPDFGDVGWDTHGVPVRTESLAKQRVGRDDAFKLVTRSRFYEVLRC